MKLTVTANKDGFDGKRLRKAAGDGAKPTTFEFEVIIYDDGSNNLGSWMDLDKSAEKKLASATKAHLKRKTKAEPEAESEDDSKSEDKDDSKSESEEKTA